MTKIRNCYRGKNLNNINVKKGQSYHNAVEEVSNSMLSEEDVPDDLFLAYVDPDEDEFGCQEDKEVGCIDCKSDPDYIYCGDDLPNLGIRKGDTFEEIFEAINDAVGNPVITTIDVNVVNTNSQSFINETTDEDVTLVFPDTQVTVLDQNEGVVSQDYYPSGEDVIIHVEIPECEAGEITIKNGNGDTLGTVTVEPNSEEEFIVGDSEVEITSGGNTIATVTVPAEGSATHDIPQTEIEITIEDQDGNVLNTYGATNPAGSNLTDTIVVNGVDSTIQIENTDETLLGSPIPVTYGANGQLITIPDTTVQLKNTDGQNIGSAQTLPSGVSHSITAPDGELTLNGDNFGNVPSGAVRALNVVNEEKQSINVRQDVGAPDNIEVSHTAIKQNGTQVGDIWAGGQAELTIKNQNGSDVDLLNWVFNGSSYGNADDNTLEITVDAGSTPSTQYIGRMPFKTGLTVSTATGDDGDTQRGSEFFTLPIVNGVQMLNHFGNKWRFTGVTGGYWDMDTNTNRNADGTPTNWEGTIPDWLILDHATRTIDGDILCWYALNGYGVNGFSFDTMFEHGRNLNIRGLTGWTPPNLNEMWSIFYNGRINSPFNGSIVSGTFNTSTGMSLNLMYRQVVSNATQGVTYLGNHIVGGYTMYVRITNISEL